MSIANESGSGFGTTGQQGSPENVAAAGSQVKQDVKNLGSEVGALAAAKATQLKDQAQAYYETGKDRAQEYLETGRERAQEYYEMGRERAMEYEQQVENYIREKPLQSVLIAAGVGAVLGFLLRR